MSVKVEIANTENLRRIRDIFEAKDDSEALEKSMERIIREYESVHKEANGSNGEVNDLPDEYWDDLFSEPPIPAEVIDRALRAERD